MKRCCCWTDLRFPVVIASMFSLMTSWTQIFAEVAMWWIGFWKLGNNPTGIANSFLTRSSQTGCPLSSWDAVTQPPDNSTQDEGTAVPEPFQDDNTSLGLFVALTAMDVLMIFFSLLLMLGVSRGQSGRCLVLSWIIFLVVYIGYEAAFNVLWYMYYGVVSYQNVFVTPIIIMLIYWILKVFFNLGGLLVGIVYFRQLYATDYTVPYASSVGYPIMAYPSQHSSSGIHHQSSIEPKSPPSYHSADPYQPAPLDQTPTLAVARVNNDRYNNQI